MQALKIAIIQLTIWYQITCVNPHVKIRNNNLNIFFTVKLLWSLDSVIGIATGYGLDG
jgi:hypothetical protein